MPPSITHAIAGGIGAFIAFIGLNYSGIVVRNSAGLVKLGELKSQAVLLSAIGFIIICALMIWRVRGAIVIGMIAAAIIGIAMGVVEFYGVTSAPSSMAPTFLKLDWRGIIRWEMIPVIIVFLFMDLFDSVGTLVGVGERAGLMKDGKLPRANQALLADAIGTSLGAVLGTSTVTSYIESAAGVSEGSRTGLSNMATALLFFAAVFFYPLVRTIGGGCGTAGGMLFPVIGPALIIVGCMMMRAVAKINWDDLSDAIPSFLIFLGIPLTYRIADGLSFGFISYPILKLFAGKAKEVHWLLYVLAVVFILRYAFL